MLKAFYQINIKIFCDMLMMEAIFDFPSNVSAYFLFSCEEKTWQKYFYNIMFVLLDKTNRIMRTYLEKIFFFVQPMTMCTINQILHWNRLYLTYLHILFANRYLSKLGGFLFWLLWSLHELKASGAIIRIKKNMFPEFHIKFYKISVSKVRFTSILLEKEVCYVTLCGYFG